MFANPVSNRDSGQRCPEILKEPLLRVLSKLEHFEPVSVAALLLSVSTAPIQTRVPQPEPVIDETRAPLYDVAAILAGDKSAFEDMVRAESGRLFRVILRVIRDEDEAQSIMQETFLQAFRRLDSFRKESKFSTWLYAIGINLARGAVRKLSRSNSIGDEDLERLQPQFKDGMAMSPSIPWAPDRLLERRELHRVVRDAISRLPEDYRIVLNLRDIEEIATPEVAEMLEISEGAVRVRVHRARQALRKLLEEYMS